MRTRVSPDLREERIKELLTMVELWDRRKGSVRKFSGGMKRRLEIARGLIHRPRVLFLDEPTIGLDPQTRRHIWEYLLRVREQEKLTIFLTTQYLDEAENCDRIAIIDGGKIVALDSRDGLKRQVGGELITFRTPDTAAAAEDVKARYGVEPQITDGTVRFHVDAGDKFLPEFVRSVPFPLETISLERPSLDDVFITLTATRSATRSSVRANRCWGACAGGADDRDLARHMGCLLPRDAALRDRAVAHRLGPGVPVALPGHLRRRLR